jgi:hypothetical protein
MTDCECLDAGPASSKVAFRFQSKSTTSLLQFFQLWLGHDWDPMIHMDHCSSQERHTFNNSIPLLHIYIITDTNTMLHAWAWPDRARRCPAKHGVADVVTLRVQLRWQNVQLLLVENIFVPFWLPHTNTSKRKTKCIFKKKTRKN